MPPTISILGAGWLGLPLGALLAERGYAVKGSTTSPEKMPLLREAGLRPFLISVEETVEGEQPDSFFESEVLVLNIPPGRRREDVQERYPRQVEAVLGRARAGGVRRLLFVSSTGIYGDGQGRVTEANAPAPDSASGRALLAAEQAISSQKDVQATIVRFGGLVGGDRQPGRWLAGRKGLRNGDAPVNLVHRDDCIQIIYRIIQREKWGETYNGCAERHPSRREFYVFQAKKSGLAPPEFLEEEGKGKYKIISNEKVRGELDYRFIFPDPMEFH